MRILMLSWEYPPHIVGGLGTHVAELTSALAAQGMELFVVTPLLRGGEPEETISERLRVRRVGLAFGETHSFTSFVARANEELERVAYKVYEEVGEFDIIHTHDWLTSTSAIALKQHWYTPLIATIHATERGRGRGLLQGEHALQINNLEWQLSYEAWRIIVCSRFMTQQLVDTFQTPFDKIDVVPNGTDIPPSPFSTNEERLTFRRTYAHDDERIIFFVGRIVYEKGLHILLDALPKVTSQVKARLVIAGTGAYLDTLKEQAEAMGISHLVTCTGFISDEERDGLYHVADVTTFPSLYEPFGIVVLEAYAAESPVVVSQTGGLMEVVSPDETGLVVPPGNADALAESIVETLQNTQQTRIRVEKARRVLVEQYSWKSIARETINVYERVYEEWKKSSWRKEKMHPNTEPLCRLASQAAGK